MRRIVFLYLFFFVYSVYSQSDKYFINDTKDFGIIFDNEIKQHTFIFINTSNNKLQIKNINNICNCSNADWTKKMLNPKDTGFVFITFNPLNRPGNFSHTLEIIWNNNDESMVTFKGFVQTQIEDIERELPYKYGNFRFKYKNLNIGNIVQGEKVKKEFIVYNDGNVPIQLYTNKDYDKYQFIIDVEPTPLEGKKLGKMIVYYNSNINTELGYNSFELQIKTNDKNSNPKNLKAIVNLIKPSPDQNVENPPKIATEPYSYDFGILNGEEEAIGIIKIKNIGFSDLKIEKIQKNCDCLETKLKSNTIAPGEYSNLNIIFYAKGRNGKQYTNIQVFSNDPINPAIRLPIVAEIKNK